jgi:enoyl-CoA hydratase/carnithine racemase
VPAAELLDEAMGLARNLAEKAPRAIALAKLAVNEGTTLPLDQAIELEAQLFGQAAETEDRREGTRAFMEKRQPQWSGK